MKMEIGRKRGLPWVLNPISLSSAYLGTRGFNEGRDDVKI